MPFFLLLQAGDEKNQFLKPFLHLTLRFLHRRSATWGAKQLGNGSPEGTLSSSARGNWAESSALNSWRCSRLRARASPLSGQRYCSWTKSLSRRLRNLEMIRFPCKYQRTGVSHGFKVVQDFCPSAMPSCACWQRQRTVASQYHSEETPIGIGFRLRSIMFRNHEGTVHAW